jgi:hypothetical protein
MDAAVGFLRPRPRTTARPHRRTRPRHRKTLATSFRHVIEDACAPRSPLTARVPVQRDQVLAARNDLEALIVHLHDLGHPVKPEGMRLAHELLCDGDGPLYQPAEPATLRRRVRLIREAME